MKIRLITAAVSCALLSACQNPASVITQKNYDTTDAFLKTVANDAQRQTGDIESTFEKVQGIYLGSKSVAIRQDLTLPDAFYVPKVFSSAGSLSLQQAAAEISSKSGIPVRVSPDIYNQKDVAIPNVYLATQGSTKQILDQLVSDTGLGWTYNATTNTATIQKSITRVFRIKSSIGSSTIDHDVGDSSGQQNGLSNGVKIKSKYTLNPLDSILASVKTVLTPKGSAITTVTNSIIVTDTAEAVEKASQIIEREDEILSRNANVRIEIISLSMNNTQAAQFNADALYRDINKFGIGIQTPASVVGPGGAKVSTSVLSQTPGHTDGSRAFVELLNQYGVAKIERDLNVPVSNLGNYSVELPKQRRFLAKSTPTPASLAGTTPGVPGFETETVNYGFKLYLLPNIFDSNVMRLKFSLSIYDVSITKIETGTNVILQDPFISGFQLPADLTLQPNQTTMVTGLEINNNDFKTNGLLPNSTFGGGQSENRVTEKYYVLITPTIKANTQ